MTTSIRIDDDAHGQLSAVREKMRADKIDGATLSDSIRWMMSEANLTTTVTIDDEGNRKYTLDAQEN